MTQRLTLEKGIERLNMHNAKKKWAEKVGNALVSNNKHSLNAYFLDWKLSGKKGDLNAFLRAVSRAHQNATKGTNAVLERAEKEQQRKPAKIHRLR